MKTLTVLMLALSAMLSGCIAYDAPYRDEPMHRSDRDHDRGYDRDHHEHRGDRGYDRDRNDDRR
jgi:hypothetical protein